MGGAVVIMDLAGIVIGMLIISMASVAMMWGMGDRS